MYTQGCRPRAVHPGMQTQGCRPRDADPRMQTQGCTPRDADPRMQTQGWKPRDADPDCLGTCSLCLPDLRTRKEQTLEPRIQHLENLALSLPKTSNLISNEAFCRTLFPTPRLAPKIREIFPSIRCQRATMLLNH